MKNIPTLILPCLLWLAPVLTTQAQDKTQSQWYTSSQQLPYGTKFNFTIDQSPAYLIAPKKPLKGNPWIWRARFPGFHAEMDKTLIQRGFHLAYVDVAGEFGCLTAVLRGDKLYTFLTEQRNLSRRPALEGVSRGGLFVYNWAAKNPSRVACIYCDTPVCDFRSWPGGKGKGLGSQAAWKQCLKVYGLTEQSFDSYVGHPIDQAQVIAKAKIPVLHIVSDNDRVVPPNENTDVLRSRLESFDHEMKVIRVPEGTAKSNGHHFTHPEPGTVVEFIWNHARVTE